MEEFPQPTKRWRPRYRRAFVRSHVAAALVLIFFNGLLRSGDRDVPSATSSLRRRHPKFANARIFLGVCLRGGFSREFNEAMEARFGLDGDDNFENEKRFMNDGIGGPEFFAAVRSEIEAAFRNETKIKEIREAFPAIVKRVTTLTKDLDWELEDIEKATKQAKRDVAEEMRKWENPYGEEVEGISKTATRTLLELERNRTSGNTSRVYSAAEMMAKLSFRSDGTKAVFASVDRTQYSFSPVHAFSNIPSSVGIGPVLSSPWFHVEVLELLKDRVTSGSRVLVIGAGSGYVATLFSLLQEHGNNGRTEGIGLDGSNAPRPGCVDIVDSVKDNLETAEYNIRKSYEHLVEDERICFHHVIESHAGPENGTYDAIYVCEPPRRDIAYSWQMFLSTKLATNGTLLVPFDLDESSETQETYTEKVPALEDIIPKARQSFGLKEMLANMTKQQRKEWRSDERIKQRFVGDTPQESMQLLMSTETEELVETTKPVDNKISYLEFYKKRLSDWNEKIEMESSKKRMKRGKKVPKAQRSNETKSANRTLDTAGEPVHGRSYFTVYKKSTVANSIKPTRSVLTCNLLSNASISWLAAK